MRKLLRISARVISCILLLAVLAILAVRTEYVQNRLVGQAARQLTAKLGTEVKVDRVSISLFNRLHLEGLLVRDLRKDTLLHVGELSILLTDWFFLHDETDIRYIGLNDVLLNTSRRDSVWNYQFLVDAFLSPAKKDTTKKRRPLLLQRIEVNRLRFSEVDAWAGRTTRFSVRHFDLDADEIDLDRKKVFIHEIDLKEPFFSIDDFPGNRPPRPKKPGSPRSSPEKASCNGIPTDGTSWPIPCASPTAASATTCAWSATRPGNGPHWPTSTTGTSTSRISTPRSRTWDG